MKKIKTLKCYNGIQFPERKQGLKTNLKEGEHELINLEGSGVFLSAHVSKQGGDNNISFIDLTIDGKNVFNISYAAMINLGFIQPNPFGLVLLQKGTINNVTLGFPYPLKFKKSLKISLITREKDIKQVITNVIFGKR